MFSRRFRARLKIITQKTLASWRLGTRVVFCFAVGAVVLFATRGGNYDNRFTFRGPQNVGDDIILIHLSRDDVTWMGGVNDHTPNNMIWSLKEIVETSDSFFWHPAIWNQAFARVLKENPKAIVVTLYFGDETVRGTMTPKEQNLFQGPKIFWAAKADSDKHAILPGLSVANGQNAGILDLRSDPDGKVRHFLGVNTSLPHLGVRISNLLTSAINPSSVPLSAFARIGEPINFMGPQGTYRSYSFSDLLRGRIDPKIFHNKIVIFDVKDIPSHSFQTPVGVLSSGELLANVVYDFINHRWVTPIPQWLNILYIFLIVLTSLWIIFEYPQAVAFVFLGFLAVGVLALSAALFDLQTIWLPAAAPLSALLATYVVLSGYRLSESEKISWESERELHYLSEVESLKNNFLSLISHDLKTPLAKIQGITDRLLSLMESHKGEISPLALMEDLNTVRRTSEELRQYIASILQLTRVEARNIKLTKEVCDINTIVGEVVQRVNPLAQAKNIEISQDLEPIFSIEVDRNLISEVILNLLENAVKYSEPTGGLIAVTTQEIDNEVRVEVTDNGGGIAEEDIPKIFDKFYRGSDDKTMRVTGTGLGLYLVKYFIELHGGRVFIDSKQGKGTKIGFYLPLDEPEENYADFTRSHRG